MATKKRIDRMVRILKNRQIDLSVVCENIHDPHNVSAILRSCDAVGVHNVSLLYTNEEFPKLGKKSSASAKKWININNFTNKFELKNYLKSVNLSIYATYIDKEAISVFDIDWTKPSAIIVGNEHRGITEDLLDITDQKIFIPMFGMIESLNVSVATAVILYEAARQRIAKGMYPNPKLTEDWIKKILGEWSDK